MWGGSRERLPGRMLEPATQRDPGPDDTPCKRHCQLDWPAAPRRFRQKPDAIVLTQPHR